MMREPMHTPVVYGVSGQARVGDSYGPPNQHLPNETMPARRSDRRLAGGCAATATYLVYLARVNDDETQHGVSTSAPKDKRFLLGSGGQAGRQ